MPWYTVRSHNLGNLTSQSRILVWMTNFSNTAVLLLLVSSWSIADRCREVRGLSRFFTPRGIWHRRYYSRKEGYSPRHETINTNIVLVRLTLLHVSVITIDSNEESSSSRSSFAKCTTAVDAGGDNPTQKAISAGVARCISTPCTQTCENDSAGLYSQWLPQ